jgi:hypothetical protein
MARSLQVVCKTSETGAQSAQIAAGSLQKELAEPDHRGHLDLKESNGTQRTT